MLKDCQEYLMASFNIPDKEGNCLLFRSPLKNRSAESSPITTLQKSGNNLQQVFSSHSSPSNSYNKYFSGGKVSSPPSTIQESVKGPLGTIQKNYCSPLATRESLGRSSGTGSTTTSSTSPKTSPLSGHHNLSFPNSSSVQKEENGCGGRHRDYANVSMTKKGVLGGGKSTVLEAQRKVSAASAGGKKGVWLRERRNSFREAVEKGKEGKELRVKGSEMGKMAYESIWFENKSGGPDQSQHHHRSSHNQTAEPQTQANGRTSSGRRPVAPHEDSTPPSHVTSEQREQRQQVRNHHAISGNYENVSLEMESSGYEPVNFRDGGPASLRNAGDPNSKALHQLQSVGLVAEVISQSQQQQYPQPMSLTSGMRAVLSRTGSGESVTAKGDPPPYKDPPQPSRVSFDRTPPPPFTSPRRQPQHQEQQQQQQHRQRSRQPKSPSGHTPPSYAKQLPAAKSHSRDSGGESLG